MPDSASHVTQLLAAWRNGDSEAPRRLMPLVYDRLRRIARQHLARERAGHTVQATALVNEAFLQVVKIGVGELRPPETHRSHVGRNGGVGDDDGDAFGLVFVDDV